MNLRAFRVACALLAAAAGSAAAGPVAGKIEIPTQGPSRPPVRAKGFLDRAPNPVAPLRPVNPFPQMVVVLEGGPMPVPPPAPAAIRWDLLGDSFQRPVMAAQAGAEITLRNRGRGAPVIVASGQADLLPKKPLNPTAEVNFSVAQPGVVELVDETTPYLRARVVIVGSPYYAVPDDKGRFEIADVPPGEWTVRVYYATGWIDQLDDKVTVGPKKVEHNPKLPPGLPVKAP